MIKLEIKQSEYDSLVIKDNNTIYIISDNIGKIYKGYNLINKTNEFYSPKISSLSIVTLPNKDYQVIGRPLDLTGLVVQGNYDNGDYEIITNYTTIPANGAILTSTDTSIIISYQNVNYTYNINLVPMAQDYLCFTALTAGATISLPNIENYYFIVYSYDRKNWSSCTQQTIITLNNIGDKVYFKLSEGNGYAGTFVMTGQIAASGNVYTLLNIDRESSSIHIDGLNSLFKNCTSLVTPPYFEPLENSISNAPFIFMYQGCTSLTSVPNLPIVLEVEEPTFGYLSMFEGCTSLQVNDAPVPGVAEQAWRIPAKGEFTEPLQIPSIFLDCPGTRSEEYGDCTIDNGSRTYYTQNKPI